MRLKNLRKYALIFDWVVSYGSIFKIFEDNFENYILVDEKLNFTEKAAPKIPTAKEAAKHKAGGGNVEIRQ